MAWNIHLHQYLMGCALVAGGLTLEMEFPHLGFCTLTTDVAFDSQCQGSRLRISNKKREYLYIVSFFNFVVVGYKHKIVPTAGEKCICKLKINSQEMFLLAILCRLLGLTALLAHVLQACQNDVGHCSSFFSSQTCLLPHGFVHILTDVCDCLHTYDVVYEQCV